MQIRSEGKIKKQISALRQQHSQYRIDIVSLLDEGYTEIKSLNDVVIEKMKQLDLSTECNLKSSQNQDKELNESECKDVHISADPRPVSITKACICMFCFMMLLLEHETCLQELYRHKKIIIF